MTSRPRRSRSAPDASLHLDATLGRLRDGSGRVFDPRERRWIAPGDDATFAGRASRGAKGRPIAGPPVDVRAAVRWLQRDSGLPLRVPVAVIGPRDPSPAQYRAAEAIGAGVAELGLPLICGGRSGIMEAACKGASKVGGVSIAILPDADPAAANTYATLVVATGIGEARNAVIARAALCAVAVGDSFGTVSEIALARQFGKTVIALPGAATLAGVISAPNPAAALRWVAAAALALLPADVARA